jgi:hypothetical protein
MCDQGAMDDVAGIDVVIALEKYGIPFTGANSKSFEISKEE